MSLDELARSEHVRRLNATDYARLAEGGVLREPIELYSGVVVEGGEPRRWTRREFHRMVELGVLREDERVELVDGMLLRMSPIGPLHVEVVRRFHEALLLALRDRYVVLAQSPIAILDDAEPYPDVAVVPLADYSQQLPRQAHLLVEVADSSLRYDRGEKARLYASAAVPEYWLVNLVDRVVELHSAPKGDVYQAVRVVERDATLASAAVPVTLSLAALLPPR